MAFSLVTDFDRLSDLIEFREKRERVLKIGFIEKNSCTSTKKISHSLLIINIYLYLC